MKKKDNVVIWNFSNWENDKLSECKQWAFWTFHSILLKLFENSQLYTVNKFNYSKSSNNLFLVFIDFHTKPIMWACKIPSFINICRDIQQTPYKLKKYRSLPGQQMHKGSKRVQFYFRNFHWKKFSGLNSKIWHLTHSDSNEESIFMISVFHLKNGSLCHL